MKLLPALIIVLLVSIILFPLLILELAFNGQWGLAAGLFVSGIFWFPLLLIIIFALGMWYLWMHISRPVQIVVVILLFIIGLSLTEVAVGIPFDVLAVIGVLYTIMGHGPSNRGIRRV
ncbi:MAG: hypothetical protein ACYCQJ_12980 [Nitrososphaerales archaeon]